MLRTLGLAVFLAAAALLSVAVSASAEPQLSDDLTVCRDRQNDVKIRADACEKVIAGGNAAPKDLAVALLTRGDALSTKRDYDKAITTYNDALKSDPDNVRILEGRGMRLFQHGQGRSGDSGLQRRLAEAAELRRAL